MRGPAQNCDIDIIIIIFFITIFLGEIYISRTPASTSIRRGSETIDPDAINIFTRFIISNAV